MPFPWQRACIWIKGVLIAWFWVTMTKIGKFQQNRRLCVAQLFKWLQRIALKCKEDKYQESMQTSTTPDPRHQIGK